MMMFFSVGVLLLPLVCSQQHQGWLNSPEYPLAYPINSKENWTLCAFPGFTVSLTLIHLDLENSANCERDSLMVFTGKDLIKSLCGNLSFMEMQSSINPHLHSASGGCLSTYFITDDSLPQVHTGYSAIYQMKDVDECAGQRNPCSHFCINFIGGFRCSCPHGYLLNQDNHTCNAINCGPPTPLRNAHVKFVKGSSNEYLSVIEYHCNEPYYKGEQNGNYTCSAAQAWRNTGDNTMPSCHYVCGYHKLPSYYGRIFGGQPAPLGSFPWQVYLLNRKQRGGAIIIGERWLMTAAHVLVKHATTDLEQTNNIKAYAGHNNLEEMTRFTTLDISSLHVHSNYTTDFNNDIALIKLKSPITFSANIAPVCLPQKHSQGKLYRGWVSGYGITEDFSIPNKLMYVYISSVDQTICRDSFEKKKNAFTTFPTVTDNMFCAGVMGGGKDACNGDSGSAFVVSENGVHWVKGIVSWGMESCAQNGTYGVYTKVSRYLDWINKTMSEN